MTDVRGSTAPEFERIAEVFEANFDQHGEVGAGFAVYLDGEKVVDLTGGTADSSGRPYDADTLQMVFSTTKGATAMCAHKLVERGELDLHAPVARYWPEFAAKGKADIPVAWLLSHRAGVVDTDAKLTLEQALDWDTVTAALADSTPAWEPGTAHGYHALTFGWLVGELVRRVSGLPIGEFFAREFAEPLELEFWIGLPEEQQHRVSPLIPMGQDGHREQHPPMMAAEEGDGSDDAPAGLIEMLEMFLGPDNLAAKALTAPGGAFAAESVWNEPRVWAAQIPAANGVTNAASLARLYASCVGEVDGVGSLSARTVRDATEAQVEGPDSVLVFPIPFALGFMTHSEASPLVGPHSFGHFGAGGSVGFADPRRRLAGGYVMNKMHFGLAGDPRTAALLGTLDELVD